MVSLLSASPVVAIMMRAQRPVSMSTGMGLSCTDDPGHHRLQAYAIPEGGIPPEWAALEPLPPNTKPPLGEQNASARRALWRVGTLLCTFPLDSSMVSLPTTGSSVADKHAWLRK